MRFDASDNPQPLAVTWRMILWAAALVPALLILSWSLRHARSGKSEAVMAGRSADERQRLKRIFNETPGSAESPLQGDSVRMTPPRDDADHAGSTTKIAVRSHDGQASDGESVADLDKSLLAAIEDNTFGVTAAERAAYDGVLAKVRETPLSALERMSRRQVPFAVLLLEASHYRGQLLTVEGDLRRLNRLTSSHVQATDETYEAWLFTPDSGLNPYRIVLANLPVGIAATGDVQPPLRVRATGYFFKRYSYATANDYHTAPLILAKTLTPLAPGRGTVPPVRPSRMLTIVAVGLLAAFGVGWMIVGLFSRRRPSAGNRTQVDEPVPDFKWLEPGA